MKILSPRLVFIIFLLFVGAIAKAQLAIGGGYGTLYIPAEPLRIFGPTASIEYNMAGDDRQRIAAFLNVSYFSKPSDAGSTTIFNLDGIPVAQAQTTAYKRFLYCQVGMKGLFLGDFGDRKLLPFIAGGGSFIIETERLAYKSNPAVSDNVFRYTNFGFHFGTGVQYNLQALVLELRGNFDMIIKPVAGSSVSNIVTNLRLCATFPITQ